MPSMSFMSDVHWKSCREPLKKMRQITLMLLLKKNVNIDGYSSYTLGTASIFQYTSMVLMNLSNHLIYTSIIQSNRKPNINKT